MLRFPASHVVVTELQSLRGPRHTGLRRHLDKAIFDIPGVIPKPIRSEVAVGVIGEWSVILRQPHHLNFSRDLAAGGYIPSVNSGGIACRIQVRATGVSSRLGGCAVANVIKSVLVELPSHRLSVGVGENLGVKDLSS